MLVVQGGSHKHPNKTGSPQRHVCKGCIPQRWRSQGAALYGPLSSIYQTIDLSPKLPPPGLSAGKLFTTAFPSKFGVFLANLESGSNAIQLGQMAFFSLQNLYLIRAGGNIIASYFIIISLFFRPNNVMCGPDGKITNASGGGGWDGAHCFVCGRALHAQ